MAVKRGRRDMAGEEEGQLTLSRVKKTSYKQFGQTPCGSGKIRHFLELWTEPPGCKNNKVILSSRNEPPRIDPRTCEIKVVTP